MVTLIRPGRPKEISVAQASHSERGHAARARRLDAGGRVLDDNATVGRRTQIGGSGQEYLRVWLAAAKVTAADFDGEDVEQGLARSETIGSII